MKRISVIIPTQNRPELLAETLRSVNGQTHPAAEVVVVDDGSVPPVDASALTAAHGRAIRVIRNETAMGLAFCRNLGVEIATGDYVLHLDDDDLLAAVAIEEAYSILAGNPELDLVFLGVKGFGSRAEHFNTAQREAVERVKVLGRGTESLPGITFFGRALGEALLQTVPVAFQRVVLAREKWQAVSALRWRAYRLDPVIATDEDAKRAIAGPLRDSEWAIYAAALCSRTALLDRPLYLQRCDGQGYSSLPQNRESHMLQSISIKTRLFQASQSLPELSGWKPRIRESLATALFDTAYAYFQDGKRQLSWTYLAKAVRLRPRATHLRFTIRTLLPAPRTQRVS